MANYFNVNEVYFMIKSAINSGLLTDEGKDKILENLNELEVYDVEPAKAFVMVDHDNEDLGSCSECGEFICEVDLPALKNGYSDKLEKLRYCNCCGALITHFQDETGEKIRPKEWDADD